MVLAATLKYLGGLLGILQDDPEAFLKARGSRACMNMRSLDYAELTMRRHL